MRRMVASGVAALAAIVLWTQAVAAPAKTNPAQCTFTAADGGVARSCASKHADFVSVKDYGAVGDGATDDTAAIQSALNAAGTNGHVSFCGGSPGTYKISAALLPSSGAVIRGCGAQIVLANPGTSSVPIYMFKLVSSVDVRFARLWLKGATVASGADPNALTDTGIYIDSASSATIDWVTFEKLNIGVNSVGGSNGMVSNSTFRNIVGASTASTGYGVLISNNATGWRVHHSWFFGLNYPTNSTSVMRHGVYISSGSSYSQADHNYVEKTLQAGLTTFSLASQAQQVAVSFIGNTLKDCVQANVFTDASIALSGWHRDCEIADNVVISSKGEGIIVAGLPGDATNKSEKSSVHGNHVYSSSFAGIGLEGTFDNLVEANYVYNSSQQTLGTYHGFRLTTSPQNGAAVAGAPANNVIRGNFSWGAQQKYALGDDADHATVNYVLGNTLLAGNVGAILNGNNTLVRGGNNTGGVYEDHDYEPRFIGSSVRTVALKNGIANGEFYVGTTAAAAPDLQFSNNGGIVNLTLKDNGQMTIFSMTQANLGAPANGTIVYCSDCTIANPCAGGGTGALAKRLNGVWVCN